MLVPFEAASLQANGMLFLHGPPLPKPERGRRGGVRGITRKGFLSSGAHPSGHSHHMHAHQTPIHPAGLPGPASPQQQAAFPAAAPSSDHGEESSWSP